MVFHGQHMFGGEIQSLFQSQAGRSKSARSQLKPPLADAQGWFFGACGRRRKRTTGGRAVLWAGSRAATASAALLEQKGKFPPPLLPVNTLPEAVSAPVSELTKVWSFEIQVGEIIRWQHLDREVPARFLSPAVSAPRARSAPCWQRGWGRNCWLPTLRKLRWFLPVAMSREPRAFGHQLSSSPHHRTWLPKAGCSCVGSSCFVVQHGWVGCVPVGSQGPLQEEIFVRP